MKEDLSSLEEKIRLGRGGEVRQALTRIGRKRVKIPAADLAKVAQLCWRVGLADTGLKILHPVMRPKARQPQSADPWQVAEYAACLIRVGATEEASQIIFEVDPKRVPQAWLYRAFVKIGQWDYDEGIKLLRSYLKTDLTPYQKLVAQVNLAAALIYERKHEEAKYLLRELTHQTSLRRWNLLLANALELSAANFVYEHKPRQAEPFLEKGEKLLLSHGSLDALFIEKWRGIIRFQRQKDLRSAQSHLEKVRLAAREVGHWETLRDCDRFEVLRTRSQDLFHKIYFGTPYPSYRKHLLHELDWKEELPEAFDWTLGESGRFGKPLDFLFGATGLKPGQALFRLALELASDFYHPHRVGPLFHRLFPGQFYHPETSRHRVHEVVRRLRHWFGEQKFPLTIQEKNGQYWYDSKKTCSVKVPRDPGQVARWRLVVENLRGHFTSGEFGVQEASQYLQISSMSLLRFLKEALHHNAVERLGKGKATRYRFTPKI